MPSGPHDALGQTCVEMPTGKTAGGINVRRRRGGSTGMLNTLTWVPCWSRDQKIEPLLWVTAPSCEASREWVNAILLSWHLNGNNSTNYSAVLKTTTIKVSSILCFSIRDCRWGKGKVGSLLLLCLVWGKSWAIFIGVCDHHNCPSSVPWGRVQAILGS